MTDTELDLEFNPFDPDFVADPYPTYARLREAGRILWFPAIGGRVRSLAPPDASLPGVYMLTSYDDCMAFLRDDRISSDPMKSDLFRALIMMQLGGEETPAINLVKHLLLFMDPPDHTRMRSLANAAFSRRAVEELRPRIYEIVDGLVEEGLERGEIDLMEAFAYPLPVIVIAEMLGVPLEDRERFSTWSRQLIDLFGTESMTTENTEQGNAAVTVFREYFTDLLADRRRSPRDDLLTAFAEVEEEGERLSTDELLATCMLLLIAGHETTANLIGLGTLALLRHPRSLEAMRNDPSLSSSGVEELLRFDSPIQMTARTTISEVEIAGVTIPAAQRVAVALGSCNHDPQRFERPEELVLDRSPNPHLSFGGGIHFCLGAPLARLEARIAFSRLFERTKDIQLAAEELDWRRTFPIRGLRSLPVTLS